MAEREPPSPLKNMPDFKRPKGAHGMATNTRSISSAIEASIESTEASKIKKIGHYHLKPLNKFDGTQLPTKAEVLQRIFKLRDESHNQSMKSISMVVFTEIEEIYLSLIHI